MCSNLAMCVARSWYYNLSAEALSGTILGKPFFAAPAMNTYMWHQNITSEQLEILKKRGIKVFEPLSKKLACGDIGKGAMIDVETIAEAAANNL